MIIRFVRMLSGAFFFAALVLPLSARDSAPEADEVFGFPRFKPIRTHFQPPVIDGFISDALPAAVKPDTGWRAAARYTISNGVIVPDIVFQGLKEQKGDFLDISFEVRHDPSLDEGDAVIIGVRPLEHSPPAEWRENDIVIIVYPFAENGGPLSGAPARVEIWKYKSEAGWRDVSADVKGCRWAFRAFDMTQDSWGWDLECRVPTSVSAGGEAWINLPDRFYFYWNVVRVQSGPMPTVSQFFWPRRCRPLAGALAPAALSPGEWGRAEKTDAMKFKGLWIEPSDIVVQANPAFSAASDDFRIAYDPSLTIPHAFSVTVRNEISWDAGAYVDFADADNVSVALWSADWGIAGRNPGPDWTPLDRLFVPETPFLNPTKPKSVPKAKNPITPGTTVFNYKGGFGPHLPDDVRTTGRRCLYAELSAPAGTFFRTLGTYRNMVSTTAQELREKAVLSVRGYGPPPAGTSSHTYLLRAEKKARLERSENSFFSGGGEILEADEAKTESRSDIYSILEWTFHGFLLTGDTLNIRGRSFTVALPTGSFGYMVRRPTEVRAWNEYVENAEALDEKTFRVNIEADGTAEITTGFKTAESTGVFFGVRAGAAVPISVPAGAYIIGPSTCLEFGIKFTQLLSLFADLGYNYLINPAGGDGFNLFFARIGLRVAVKLSDDISMYVQGGVFGYTPDFSAFNLDIEVGAAGSLALGRDLALEAGLNYVLGIGTDSFAGLMPGFGIIFKF